MKRVCYKMLFTMDTLLIYSLLTYDQQGIKRNQSSLPFFEAFSAVQMCNVNAASAVVHTIRFDSFSRL